LSRWLRRGRKEFQHDCHDCSTGPRRGRSGSGRQCAGGETDPRPRPGGPRRHPGFRAPGRLVTFSHSMPALRRPAPVRRISSFAARKARYTCLATATKLSRIPSAPMNFPCKARSPALRVEAGGPEQSRRSCRANLQTGSTGTVSPPRRLMPATSSIVSAVGGPASGTSRSATAIPAPLSSATSPTSSRLTSNGTARPSDSRTTRMRTAY
jgi:hypothetical protein